MLELLKSSYMSQNPSWKLPVCFLMRILRTSKKHLARNELGHGGMIDMNVEHIVLLGDSIFDNKSYVESESDVIGHLSKILPIGSKATLLAVDGSTTSEIAAQVAQVPKDVTLIAVSVGGNDLLHRRYELNETERTGIELLGFLSSVGEEFYKQYEAAIKIVAELRIPTCLCTIYNGNLDPPESTMAKAVVAIYNDKIYRVANRYRMAVIELRSVCTSAEDYANPIEPSGTGGKKIASAIAAFFQRRLAQKAKV
jgi:hypothetical protein